MENTCYTKIKSYWTGSDVFLPYIGTCNPCRQYASSNKVMWAIGKCQMCKLQYKQMQISALILTGLNGFTIVESIVNLIHN